MDDRLTARYEQELRDLNKAEHPGIAALLSKIDGQRRVIKNQVDKIERQRSQIRTGHEEAAKRKEECTKQDRVIAEQGDEIQELREQIARLKDSAKEDH